MAKKGNGLNGLKGDQVRKVIDLLEQLLDLQDRFVDSLNNANNIQSYINENMKIQKQLQKEGVNISKEEASQAADILRKQEAIKENQKQIKKKSQENLKSDSELMNEILAYPQEKFSNANRNLEQRIKIRREEKFKGEISRTVIEGMRSAREQEGLAPNTKDYNRYVEEYTVSKLAKAGDKFASSSIMIDYAAKIFHKAIDKLGDMLKSGYTAQYNAFENTASNISVRQGISVDEYRRSLTSINNKLGSSMPYSSNDDLRDNVATSDILNRANSLSNIGYVANTEELYTRAIDNIVTEKIVPFLNTANEQWQRLVDFNPTIEKNIRGILKANQEEVGNNYATEEVLNTMLSNIEPMSEAAINDLAANSAGASAAVNEIINQFPQMSKEQAMEYYQRVFALNYKGADILKNGSVADKFGILNMISDGVDFTDMSNIGYTMAKSIEYDQKLGKIIGMTENKGVGNAINNNLKTDSIYNGDYKRAFVSNMESINVEAVKRVSNEVSSNLEGYAEKSLNDFVKGKNQTENEKQKNYTENAMNELVSLTTKLGNWAELIYEAIKLLPVAFFADKMMGGMKALAGGAAGGSGTGLLAAGGGAALGVIGGVAASAALVAAVQAGVTAANIQSQKHGIARAKEELVGTDYENNKTAQALYGTEYTIKDRSGFQDWWNNFTSGIGYAGSVMVQGTSSKNKNLTQWLLSNGAVKDKKAIAVWGLMMNQLGYFEDFKDGVREAKAGDWTDASADKLAKILVDAGWDKSTINRQAEEFLKAGYRPYDQSGKHIKSFDLDSGNVGLSGLPGFRAGLSRVPYDDYPALLHEDEAILTASTANELRGLIGEYRDMKQTSVNFEIIIQDQTKSLITKLDELIVNVKNINNVSPGIPKKDNITNNMVHVRGLRSFN